VNYKKIFKNKKLRFAILSLLKFIPDKQMLKIQYRIKTGRKLDLRNPERWTEKIQWYKLYYKDELMRKCADKYTVREYIKEKGYEHLLNDIYEVYMAPEEISINNLPNKFILKLSNGSSTNIVCEDKETLNIAEVRNKFRDFVKQASSSAGREWVYSGGTPRIIAERFLDDPADDNFELIDYKIFCFNGEPEYTICVGGRHTDSYHHVVYDSVWNKVSVEIGTTPANADYDLGDKFFEMMDIARTLSKDFPAVRVDLYLVKDKIYFGELTFFPWSGYMDFTPDEFDFELGSKFVLPKKNILQEENEFL